MWDFRALEGVFWIKTTEDVSYASGDDTSPVIKLSRGLLGRCDMKSQYETLDSWEKGVGFWGSLFRPELLLCLADCVGANLSINLRFGVRFSSRAFLVQQGSIGEV